MAEDPVQSLEYGPNPALSAQPPAEPAYHPMEQIEATATQPSPLSDHGTAGEADQGRAQAEAEPEPEAEEEPKAAAAPEAEQAEEEPAAKPPPAKPPAPRSHRSAGGRAGGRA
jgi:hypothetical protein